MIKTQRVFRFSYNIQDLCIVRFSLHISQEIVHLDSNTIKADKSKDIQVQVVIFIKYLKILFGQQTLKQVVLKSEE